MVRVFVVRFARNRTAQSLPAHSALFSPLLRALKCTVSLLDVRRFLAVCRCRLLQQVRVNFVMDGDKMRLDLDNVEGRELSSESEAPPEQPPAWTIK